MYDFELPIESAAGFEVSGSRRRSVVFHAIKRGFDIFACVLLLPVLLVAAVVLLVLNPFFNKGQVFFVQTRMGQHCKPFKVVKFRTMTEVPMVARGADDPLEVDRITRLGHVLRKTRIDEVPQILNVLAGQMSLIGPRPDFIHHARRYVRSIPGYRERHEVRPGISGLAQTALGYAEGNAATTAKVRADLFYINNSSLRMEAWIVWRTLVTVIGRRGA